MNYSQTLDYLYSRLPMFTRQGASAIKKDLTNTLALCDRLGNPHKKIRTIHVGGTNGKGSTSHMLAAILQTAGYKTGLYTSPHLRDFRERIRVNGQMMPEENVIAFIESQKANIEEIQPSFFEVTVAMAFDHFVKEEVDIAVIEVGLGGRLDSTNIITPLLSVITNISYDHMNILGDSLDEIAFEKAGIIKPNIPAVVGEKQDEVAGVFLRKARETNSELIFASEQWQVKANPSSEPLLSISVKPLVGENPKTFDLKLDLVGTYQLKNIKTVLSAVACLRNLNFSISQKHLETALSEVQQLTGFSGRWQTLGRAPLIICDTGHNEDGIREVLRNIRNTSYKSLHMVIGMVRDKDIHKILQLLPKDAYYYFCQPQIERAKPVEELLEEARFEGLEGTSYPSVAAALQAAKTTASPEDLIFVGGSTFVVAEIV